MKFKKGEIVIYKNGPQHYLAEIKDVVKVMEIQRLKQDGMFGEPTGELVEVEKYFIYTHTGDTAALCDGSLLIKLENQYAFQISRNRVDE